MGIKNFYRGNASNLNVNYDFTDIAEGTGIVVFQAGTSRETTNQNYFLNQNIANSDEQYTSVSADGVSDATMTLNFDLAPFNKPQRIGGRAYFVVAFRVRQGDASGGGTKGEIQILVKKVASSTTTIGTATTISIYPQNVNNTTASRLTIVPVDVTDTSFSKGDQLRVTLIATASGVSGFTGTKKIMVLHDPTNSNITHADDSVLNVTIGTTGAEANSTNSNLIRTSQFKCYIPFKIDL